MTTVTLGFFDQATGVLTLDAEQPLAEAARADLANVLTTATEMGCANPVEVLHGIGFPAWPHPTPHVRINGFWHNSLVEGPGRRSVVRFQGCPIRCVGCWVPETHDEKAGYDVGVGWMAQTLLQEGVERDGVTILGGEAFAQPHALRLLVESLRAIDPTVHILAYSGYTLKALRAKADADIDFVLDSINVLIDGPYIAVLADGAGPWTGSGNQKVHYFR